MLTSAELTTSSTMSLTNLSTIAVEDSPFKSGPAGVSAEGFSEASRLPSSVCAWARLMLGKCDSNNQARGAAKGNIRAKQQESQFLRRTVVALVPPPSSEDDRVVGNSLWDEVTR